MKKKILKLSGALCTAIGILSMTAGRVMASDAFKEIGKKPSSNDVFGGATKVVTNVGNSAIQFLLVAGAIAVVIGIILVGIGLIIFKGDSEVAKGKKHIMVIIGASIFIFGAVSIGTGLAKIGEDIGKSVNTETLGGTQGSQGSE